MHARHSRKKIDPSELRRVPRDLVDFETQAMWRGQSLTIRVVNISPLGLMGRITAQMIEGDMLSIELPQLPPVGTVVRWVEDGRIGTEFLKSIDEERYAVMRSYLPLRQNAW